MQPLFLGGHPAIDFLNSAYAPNGERIETLESGKAYLQWLAEAGLIAASEVPVLSRRFGAKALDSAAAEARRVREWLREWLLRWRDHPRANYDNEVRDLNKLLSRNAEDQFLVQKEGMYALVAVVRPGDAHDLLGLIAVQVAKLLIADTPDLVKSCASDRCTLWFLDATRSHRRMFCSPAACGNRAKVAAFRQRQRE